MVTACRTLSPSATGLYDLKDHIGLTPWANDNTTAERNTVRLNAALDAMWYSGNFTCRDGRRGPILHPIRAGGQHFYFKKSGALRLQTSLKTNGALIGSGGRTHSLPEASYVNDATGGSTSRFICTDGSAGGAFIRIRNHGFKTTGIEWFGRPYYVNDSGGQGPTTGTKVPVGFEVEGRSSEPTGGLMFYDSLIAECTDALIFRGGYYNSSNVFVSEATHADNGIVSGVNFIACSRGVVSENIQAMIWNFHNIRVMCFGGVGVVPMILCNAISGGSYHFTGTLGLDHPKITLLKVTNFSPNNADFSIANFKWDGFYGTASNYLTLFNYAGPINPDLPNQQYKVRINGHMANMVAGVDYDESKLIVIPDSSGSRLDRSNILVNVQNMDVGDFELVGDGPWYRPITPA